MISEILSGQALAFLLFLGYKSTERLQTRQYWFPFQDLVRIVIILLITSVMLFFTPRDNKGGDSFYLLYLICTASDFFGGYFLKCAYATTFSPLVVFISQLMYPMTTFVMFFQEGGKAHISFSQIISYSIILSICALINCKTTNSKRGHLLLGAFFALASNACYIINILSQHRIVKASDAISYLRNMALCSLITCPVLGATFQFKSIPRSLKEVKNFYQHNFLWLSISGLAFAIFYIYGAVFIDEQSPVAFNLATLSTSMYFGLFNMISDFNPWFTLGYIVSLASSIFLLSTELK